LWLRNLPEFPRYTLRQVAIFTNIYREISRSQCVNNIPRHSLPTYYPFHPSHNLTLTVNNLCSW
jgi:hypothetical protein